MKSASNHGKGLRKEGADDCEGALQYYKQSLLYAEKCEDETMIPFELESIARIYLKMGEMDKAGEMARRSLSKYEDIKRYGTTVEEGIQRVRHVLDSITQLKHSEAGESANNA